MRPRLVTALHHTLGPWAPAWLVPTPTVIYAVTIGVVFWVFLKRSGDAGLPRDDALGAGLWAAVGGLIGARALHLLLRLPQVVSHPGMLLDPAGSTISWGAYGGGAIAFWLYLRRRHQPVLAYADVAGSVMGLGPFLGRFACLLHGDDYGRLTDVAWGITYPRGSYPFVAQVRRGLLDPLANTSLPVHPVQLYLSVAGLVLFAVCTWAYRKKRLPTGAVWFLYWALYGLMRFGFEFFRGDVSRTWVGPFPDAQLLALGVGLASLGVLGWQITHVTQLRTHGTLSGND